MAPYLVCTDIISAPKVRLPTLRGQSFFWMMWAVIGWCASSTSGYAQVLQVTNPTDAAQLDASRWFATAYSLDANSFATTKGMSHLLGDQVYLDDIQYAPRNGKNFAIQETNFALGYQVPGWRFSIFQKQSLWLDIEEKTLDLLHANMAKLNLDKALVLPIDAQFVGYQARGIKLEKAFVFPTLGDQTLTLAAGGNIFVGTDLRVIEAQGFAQQTATGFLYSVNTNDSFSGASYPYIRPANVSAQGYSLDWGLRYSLSANHSLSLAVNDDLSSVTWRNMPNSQLSVSNKLAKKDENGFTQPTLTGMNDINRRTITQVLEPKYQVSWAYTESQWYGNVWTQRIRDERMSGLNYGWHWIDDHWFELGWENAFNSISLGYIGPVFSVRYRTQPTITHQTRMEGISVSGFLLF